MSIDGQHTKWRRNIAENFNGARTLQTTDRRTEDDILNLASEVVILELVSANCFPVLLYGLECCQLNRLRPICKSLDFSSNRLFMKLFRTGSIDVVAIL